MTAQFLEEVLEATGYLERGQPAVGVEIGPGASSDRRLSRFEPDARWRSDTGLTVYFKYRQEDSSAEDVAKWHREIWNQGFAPLLWVVSPDRVCLYNGFSRPGDAADPAEHLLETFLRVDEQLTRLDALAGRFAMETGQFWEHHPAIDRRNSVDRQLLNDLRALERDLSRDGLDPVQAQGLIGRSIFAQYLIDRSIVTSAFLTKAYGQDSLSEILRDPSATAKMFEWLRDTFNGDMFPLDEPALPDTRHLARVANFLDAVDPETGQGSLFPYQFDVIPVELISSIYEQFAHSDSTINTRGTARDVHYTPLALVSLILDEISDGLTGTETVLDLSCGSGVFLVESLRRLVALRAGDNKPSREVIRSTLYRQLFGVDISESAIRVAAFSLYLAALELDPDPAPPETLTFEPLLGRTLIVGDAWDDNLPARWRNLPSRLSGPGKFDVIVGNPPWSYPGGKTRASRMRTQRWETARSPRGTSLDFLRRAMAYSHGKTRFGLVLSAVQFFSRSGTGIGFLQELIKSLTPLALVNLSFHSDWLFPRSNQPAMILLARHRTRPSGEITAVQVPWSPASRRSHMFEISRSDIICLSLAEWLRRQDLLKAAFFGTPRDMALLEKISSIHAPLSVRLRAMGSKFRAGLTAGNGSKDATFLHGLPLLTKSDAVPLSSPKELPPFTRENAAWPRNRDTFRAPLLLVHEYLKDGRTSACTAERDLVFTNTFFGASLPAEQAETARMLAPILCSSLASWFFLMTGSTFGVSKRRLLLRDLEQLPVPDLLEARRSPAGRRLVEFVRNMPPGPLSPDGWQKLDEMVLDLYELEPDERIVVRDGLLRSRWQWQPGRLKSAKMAKTKPHLVDYADVFLRTMDDWLSASNQRRMLAEVFDLPANAPLRVVRFELQNCTGPSIQEIVQPEGELKDVLIRIGDRLECPVASMLVGQRTLRVYGPGEVVIIKPAARRHWMGVAALNDADVVAAESLAGPAA